MFPGVFILNYQTGKKYSKAKNQYTDLINRDCNRASSIIWSIANETAPADARNAFLTAIAQHIRSMDSTRLLSAACTKEQAADGHPENDYTISDPIIQHLDIISFHEYPGWYGSPDIGRLYDSIKAIT